VTHAVIIFVDEVFIVAVFTFFTVRVFKIPPGSTVELTPGEGWVWMNQPGGYVLEKPTES